jgi:hypothetical protein
MRLRVWCEVQKVLLWEERIVTSPAELQAIRERLNTKSSREFSHLYDALALLALYDAQTKELEAARTRIADLERECDGQRRNSSELFDECKRRGLKMEQLRAQGLSQEDREACLAGEDAARYMSQKQIVPSRERAWADTAAILRRLGGQTT